MEHFDCNAIFVNCQNYKEKICEMCGDLGVQAAIITCNRCKDACVHSYCMFGYRENGPPDWSCDHCSVGNGGKKELSEGTSKQASPKNSHGTMLPRKLPGGHGVKWEKKVQTGKTKYISVNEAIGLSSGAKKYGPQLKITGSSTATISRGNFNKPLTQVRDSFSEKSTTERLVGAAGYLKARSPKDCGASTALEPRSPNVGNASRKIIPPATQAWDPFVKSAPRIIPLVTQAWDPSVKSASPRIIPPATQALDPSVKSASIKSASPRIIPPATQAWDPSVKSASPRIIPPATQAWDPSVKTASPRIIPPATQAWDPSVGSASPRIIPPAAQAWDPSVKSASPRIIPPTTHACDPSVGTASPRIISPATQAWDPSVRSASPRIIPPATQALDPSVESASPRIIPPATQAWDPSVGSASRKIIPPEAHPCDPAEAPCWKGSFNIGGDVKLGMLSSQFQACHPSLVLSNVYELSKLLPCTLQFELFSREDIWSSLFDHYCPRKEDIGLYFLASDVERSKVFFNLLEHMRTKDLAMRSLINDTELLVFASTTLYAGSEHWDGKHFLWGLFRRVRRGRGGCMEGEMIADEDDMEIDMIGGEDVGRVDLCVNSKETTTAVICDPLVSSSSRRVLPIKREPVYDFPPGFIGR